jgi:hypothetical protein
MAKFVVTPPGTDTTLSKQAAAYILDKLNGSLSTTQACSAATCALQVN